ncbi:hypothetical protein B0H16DRAFT_1459234 [Mycena metata]|uniref:F-box domain-containing protein n=1 Tax=Mycena metata TaxID=1033252 RepID=A0AAD7J3Q9_9AGAR|nr:hypothetical protein B0H16DRAFT_1459234 [Mycena metata]
MNALFRLIWLSCLVGGVVCGDARGGGGRGIQQAYSVGGGSVHLGGGVAAALGAAGARIVSGAAARSAVAFSSALVASDNAGGAFSARAVAPVLAKAVPPARTAWPDGPDAQYGDAGASVASIVRSVAPSVVRSLGGTGAQAARVARAVSVPYVYAPVVGRACRTDPFVGVVCEILVWIEQSASLGLPNEILLQIFLLAVGPHSDAEPRRHAHYRTLFAIAGSCRHWADFVGSAGGLWSSFSLTPHRLTASLDYWLSRVHGAPLDLHLAFDDLFALYHPPSTARAPRLDTRGTIARVAPALSRCARLSVDAEASIAFPAIMRALCNANGRLLVSLSIARVYIAFLEDIVPPLDSVPNLFFRTGVPMLRFLRLCNTTVGWNNLQFYLGLEVFKLWGIRRPINPTALQLYAMLAIARCLVRLSMREVECDALPPCTHAFFTLLRLIELDLHLSGTLGVPDVLSRCRMPALRKLSLIADTEFDVRCLLACSQLLGRVIILSLQVNQVSREVLSELWANLLLVEELDISASGLPAFQALHSPDGPHGSSHLCPKLTTLVVRNVPPVAMKRFLQRRVSSGLTLQRLVMYQAVDFFEDGEADLAWIANLLGPDAFSMDPDRDLDSPMDWLKH